MKLTSKCHPACHYSFIRRKVQNGLLSYLKSGKLMGEHKIIHHVDMEGPNEMPMVHSEIEFFSPAKT